MIKYRPEIDGLRALAVLPVVLFHADFSTFSGGFVGVDVFFVISGYLITSLILSDIAKGKFSYSNFYERRARRILPALFLVILCTLPIVWWFYLPADLKDYAESVAAIPLFLSNFVFESQSGYFERATDIKPLIHTWSLAVEEQFYLFFPAILLVMLRFTKDWVFHLILVLSVLSLMLAQWGIYNAPTDTYFLLPTRIWELLVGSLVAIYLFKADDRRISDLGCAIGIAMILFSVFAYDGETPFPGLSALLPTLGTCLFIIFAGPKTITFQVFSNRHIVLLGLISYSLYLWHQPIFAIVKYQSAEELSVILRMSMIALAIVLAFVSWKYIEAPWRDASRVSRKTLIIASVGFSLFFIQFGIIGALKDGDLYRFDQKTMAISSPVSGAGCPIRKTPEKACLIGDADMEPSIVILGDSHASALSHSFDQNLKSVGKSAYSYTSGWCPPFIDVDVSNDDKKDCATVRNAGLQRAFTDDNIKTVVLHAEWANYTTGTRWGRRSERFVSDEFSTQLNTAENQRVFARGLERTVSQLTKAGKAIVIVGSVPEYNVNIPNFLAIHYSKTGLLNGTRFPITQVEYNHRNAGVQNAFDHLAESQNLSFVDPFSLFCPLNRCQKFGDDQQILYTDGNHLSLAGANKLVPYIIDLVH
jgi:peptidoglycan/LPS O-acetylase OafA/YrhL